MHRFPMRGRSVADRCPRANPLHKGSAVRNATNSIFFMRCPATWLHAIRKIEGQLADNPRLKDELEELKKLLSH